MNTPNPEGGDVRLLPCPFCGGTVHWRNGRCEPSFYVSCRACGTIGPVTVTLDTAITAWNTRHESGRSCDVGDQPRDAGQQHTIDTLALEVARRFTADTEPQRRASLQVAVIEAITRALSESAGGSVPVYQLRRPNHPDPSWQEVAREVYHHHRRMKGYEGRTLYTAPARAPGGEGNSDA